MEVFIMTPHTPPELVRENQFKAVNDDFGHTAGDAVLAATAAWLTAWAVPRASVGRLGGDELTVVLTVSVGRLAQRLAQLVRMLHTPVVLEDGRIADMAASVGAATPHTVGSRGLSLLQQAADAALHDGKHSGAPLSPRPRAPRCRPPTAAASGARERLVGGRAA
ncbi:diguanylate cyclase domain-containing protein [Streptomyces spinosus]|uniref:diguanylate cyclase domain-containing protein n=1 Tax=Streptomyces spinosus TaxID=2872623 RepID=UPI001CEC3B0E|nr:GGDEF domain-containing protein [Streptomyces spinosus]